MNNQKTHEKSWWKRNKKKVIIISGIVILAGVSYIVFKNKDALISLVKNGKTVANNVKALSENAVIEATPEIVDIISNEVISPKMPINNGEPFIVREFIRNLPNGHHPSPEKIAQALENGIVLEENQTFVTSYMKNVA